MCAHFNSGLHTRGYGDPLQLSTPRTAPLSSVTPWTDSLLPAVPGVAKEPSPEPVSVWPVIPKLPQQCQDDGPQSHQKAIPLAAPSTAPPRQPPSRLTTAHLVHSGELSRRKRSAREFAQQIAREADELFDQSVIDNPTPTWTPADYNDDILQALTMIRNVESTIDWEHQEVSTADNSPPLHPEELGGPTPSPPMSECPSPAQLGDVLSSPQELRRMTSLGSSETRGSVITTQSEELGSWVPPIRFKYTPAPLKFNTKRMKLPGGSGLKRPGIRCHVSKRPYCPPNGAIRQSHNKCLAAIKYFDPLRLKIMLDSSGAGQPADFADERFTLRVPVVLPPRTPLPSTTAETVIGLLFELCCGAESDTKSLRTSKDCSEERVTLERTASDLDRDSFRDPFELVSGADRVIRNEQIAAVSAGQPIDSPIVEFEAFAFCAPPYGSQLEPAAELNKDELKEALQGFQMQPLVARQSSVRLESFLRAQLELKSSRQHAEEAARLAAARSAQLCEVFEQKLAREKAACPPDKPADPPADRSRQQCTGTDRTRTADDSILTAPWEDGSGQELASNPPASEQVVESDKKVPAGRPERVAGGATGSIAEHALVVGDPAAAEGEAVADDVESCESHDNPLNPAELQKVVESIDRAVKHWTIDSKLQITTETLSALKAHCAALSRCFRKHRRICGNLATESTCLSLHCAPWGC